MPTFIHKTYDNVLVVGPFQPEWVERFGSRGAVFVAATLRSEISSAMQGVQAVCVYSPLEDQLDSATKSWIYEKSRRSNLNCVVIMTAETLFRELNATLTIPASGNDISESMTDQQFVESVAPQGYDFKSFDHWIPIRRKAEKDGRPHLAKDNILKYLKNLRERRMREAGVTQAREYLNARSKKRVYHSLALEKEIQEARDVVIPDDLILKGRQKYCNSHTVLVKRMYRPEVPFTDLEWAKAIHKVAIVNGFPSLREVDVYAEIQNRKRVLVREGKLVLEEEDSKAS